MLHSTRFWSTFIMIAAVLAILVSVKILIDYFSISPTERAIQHKMSHEKQSLNLLHYSLSDPSKVPPSIKELVELGYHIMIETPTYASEYIGDKMKCASCHFAGGDTTGGKNGGISLVGVAAIYPQYNQRFGQVIDLPTRINSCFERSMNGSPLPLQSKEMLALVTYLHWISKGFPIYDPVPWLGVKSLKSDYQPVTENGRKLWDLYCAMCHGKNGEGSQTIPPVWGPESFNTEAGMNHLDTLASFIYYNMPYENARLSVEEALDVAAFIVKQPRP